MPSFHPFFLIPHLTRDRRNLHVTYRIKHNRGSSHHGPSGSNNNSSSNSNSSLIRMPRRNRRNNLGSTTPSSPPVLIGSSRNSGHLSPKMLETQPPSRTNNNLLCVPKLSHTLIPHPSSVHHTFTSHLHPHTYTIVLPRYHSPQSTLP